MPSFDLYKKFNGVNRNGEVRKQQSDELIEATWYEDIGAKRAFIYDYFHDDEKLKLTGLNPENSSTKCPVDIKYIQVAYNSENKDVQGYHIQFKPSYNWKNTDISYYEDVFEKRYGSEYPIGLYIDIPDEQGIYRKWLITEEGYNLGLQFPTWYILPCDYLFQWISNGKKYQMCGVGRSQNSYNSGVWMNYRIETVENQRKCVLPMNNISETLYYNQRIILSAPIEEPICWNLSKVEQISPKGINHLTFTQDHYDQTKDAFEYEDGEISNVYNPNKIIVGMYADYYSSTVIPTDGTTPIIPPTTVYGVITCSTKAEIKVGGSYKKFNIKFYEEDTEINFKPGQWQFYVGNELANVEWTKSGLEENQIKVKTSEDYIGQNITVKYISNDGIITTLDVPVISM